ncbi:MAG TPA: hypothetical protein VLX68_05520 [Chitinivibrionales bacterium]|nr:hypothetical protein [Chitinivibrionales bacterium]
MNIRGNGGAVLPTVLIFAVFALIVASVYTAGQLTIAKPSLRGPASLQALCNARSGIWKGLELLSKKPSDTLAKINTLDSLFNKKLFGRPTAAIASDSFSGLVPDDTPLAVQPFSSDSFGDCAVSLTFLTCYKVLVSQGRFRDIIKSAKGLLGGSIYHSPDSVCFLTTGSAPEGGGRIEGTTVFPAPEAALKPVSASKPRPEPVNKKQSADQLATGELAKLVAYYRSKLGAKLDTTIPVAPLLIQNSDQAAGIPEVVNGSLLINGSFTTIAWKEKRRIFVLGDVQITGKASIEDVEFVTSGEFKCFDDARLFNVSVFCPKRLVIGDRASFSGTALTLSSLLVYKSGRIENKSIIVAYGENKGLPAAPAKTPRPQLPVSVFISQDANVDAVIVACGNPGGIQTDKNTVVKGILWAQGAICHQGTLYGVLRANELVDLPTLKARAKTSGLPAAPAVQPRNSMSGSIRRLPNVTEYFMPFFLGRQIIARWEEG